MSLRDFRQKIVAIQKKKVKKKLKIFKNCVDTFFNKVYIHYHRRTTQERHIKASEMSNSFLTKQGRKEAIEQVRFY